MFPDPSDSPTRHTHCLAGFHPTTPGTTWSWDVGGWIRTFHNVVHLHLGSFAWADRAAPLAPFYGFSRTVRSLRRTSAPFEIFDLVCSCPLLEDLALVTLHHIRGMTRGSAPLTSPKFTGSLELSLLDTIYYATNRLLGFRDGLHFTDITLSWSGEDIGSATDLASRCSETLESLTISPSPLSASPPASLIGHYLTAARRS